MLLSSTAVPPLQEAKVDPLETEAALPLSGITALDTEAASPLSGITALDTEAALPLSGMTASESVMSPERLCRLVVSPL